MTTSLKDTSKADNMELKNKIIKNAPYIIFIIIACISFYFLIQQFGQTYFEFDKGELRKEDGEAVCVKQKVKTLHKYYQNANVVILTKNVIRKNVFAV